ncbi:carboxymuconolactone decarboxylase family protein [Blastopirellula sp. J2-11]|uniref:carboxymuconolactone decarboxylase family protein n=1 Tax=Blastopirellula sp. J2-11 TaxID=2943192 RepID=UPI0021C83E0A|nr:carboxymuconolactone decarboxylase family protein [Blastopirellula sp. J2-11]UUO06678.1 carboxymuconolactone decarboxylase family protein [Blastopirellula sp. J2-11]
MSERLDYFALSPEPFRHLMAIEKHLHKSTLGHVLMELVKLRVSQINGCAYCLNMHSTLLRKAGEPAHRIDLVAAWREAPCYSDRERAALAWAEAVTLLPQHQVTDELYDALAAQFDETEIVDLTAAIANINAWNRFAVPFKKTPEIEAAMSA